MPEQIVRLKEILEGFDMGVTDLHRLMIEKGFDITYATLSRIAHNHTSPRVDTVKMIADSLEVDIKDMFFDSERSMIPIYRKDENDRTIVVGYIGADRIKGTTKNYKI